MQSKYDPNDRLKVVDMQTLSDINSPDDITRVEPIENKVPFDASGINETSGTETAPPSKAQKKMEGKSWVFI